MAYIGHLPGRQSKDRFGFLHQFFGIPKKEYFAAFVKKLGLLLPVSSELYTAHDGYFKRAHIMRTNIVFPEQVQLHPVFLVLPPETGPVGNRKKAYAFFAVYRRFIPTVA